MSQLTESERRKSSSSINMQDGAIMNTENGIKSNSSVCSSASFKGFCNSKKHDNPSLSNKSTKKLTIDLSKTPIYEFICFFSQGKKQRKIVILLLN